MSDNGRLGLRSVVPSGYTNGLNLLRAFPTPAAQFRGLQIYNAADSQPQPAVVTSLDLFTDAALSSGATTGSLIKGWQAGLNSGTSCNFTSAGTPTGVSNSIAPGTFFNNPMGRGLLTFGGNAAGYLQGSKTAASGFYDFMHQGPCTLYFTINPTLGDIGYFFDTGAGIAGGPGITAFADSTSPKVGQIGVRVRGGVGAGANGTQTLLIATASTTVHALIPGSLTTVCITIDGSLNCKVYLNNALHLTGTLSAKSDQHARYAMCVGSDPAGAIPFTGAMALMACCNVLHTDAERTANHQFINANFGSATDIACLGDSITCGTTPFTGTDSNLLGAARNYADWPTRMQQFLGAPYTVTNFAISGAQSDAIKTGQLELTTGPYRTHYRIYTFLGGNNDIGVGSQTGVQTWGASLASAGTRVQAIFDEITNDSSSFLIAGICLPNKGASSYPAWSGTQQGYFDYLANAIKTYVPPSGNPNYAWVDTFTPFSTPGDPYTMLANGTFDKLHPNQIIADVVACIFANKILQLGL